MLNVTVENIGELAVVECEAELCRAQPHSNCRETVTSLTEARIVVLELSGTVFSKTEVSAC